MKIYYSKTTKLFAGAGNISNEYTAEQVEFIEVNESDWLNFLNLSQGKEIYIENNELNSRDRQLTFEENRNLITKKSKMYLQNTDWIVIKNTELTESNYATELANRVLARQAINDAEVATTQAELDAINIDFTN